MPAGGNWVAQNKIRPGAYINFVYKGKQNLTIGSRGVIAVATDLAWGPDNEIIKVTANEMITGNSLPIIGVVADGNAESLPIRLALASATTALIFKANPGGNKATKTDATTGYAITAKYPGTFGNKLSVVILKDVPNEGEYTVNVLVDGVKKESFIVTSASALTEIESAYVNINSLVTFTDTGDGATTTYTLSTTPESIESVKVGDVEVTDYSLSGTTVTFTTAPSNGEDIEIKYYTKLVPTSGITLTGGTNGTELTDFSSFYEAIQYKTFQTICINSMSVTVMNSLISFVKDLRDNQGKKVVGVVYDKDNTDYEGIISVNQGFKNDVDTVTPQLFQIYVASLSAGANVNESLTCAEITEATEIINPIKESDVESALQSGKFILTYRQDGAVVIEKDINTLRTFTADKGYPFSKNRVLRCLDEIGNSICLKFNQNYAGKVDNNDENRKLFKSEIINLMVTLQNIGAIQNFESADITVYRGEDIDSVVVDLNVQPVDSMEKLYMTVFVHA